MQPSDPCFGDDALVEALTGRQREIVVLLTEGLTNQEIAHRLALEPGTVGDQIAQIKLLLGMTRRVQVAVWAVKQGLVPSDASVC